MTYLRNEILSSDQDLEKSIAEVYAKNIANRK